jgi:flagellar basal body rod protein FlgG
LDAYSQQIDLFLTFAPPKSTHFRHGIRDARTASEMDPITVAAAGGLRARMEALDMLANNIANASTAGFKRDSEFYALYETAEAAAQGYGTAALPLIEKPWTDFAQGTLQQTGNPVDLALSGPGFFAVQGPSGALYTRTGSFQIASTGLVATQEGYPLRLVGGQTLRVQPGPFQISSDGTVRQGEQTLGRLEIADFPEGTLTKQGATLFRPIDPAQAPLAAAGTEVHQGKLEAANVSSAESAVRLVGLMRQFEALQKAIGIGAEMNRKSIEEVARVGS